MPLSETEVKRTLSVFVDGFEHVCPTMRAFAKSLGLVSGSAAVARLEMMKRRGWVEHDDTVPRRGRWKLTDQGRAVLSDL